MINILLVVAVTVISFIATNLENLLLLVVFLSNSAQSKNSVALGYLAAMLIIIGLARIISAISAIIPNQFLGLLGLIPLTLGIWELMKILRHKVSKTVSDSSVAMQSKSFVTITTIMIANAGDSLAVFVSLFADTQWYLKWLIWVSTLAMTFIWCNLALWLVRFNKISQFRQTFTQVLTPFLLIGIGIYILMNSPTDMIP